MTTDNKNLDADAPNYEADECKAPDCDCDAKSGCVASTNSPKFRYELEYRSRVRVGVSAPRWYTYETETIEKDEKTLCVKSGVLEILKDTMEFLNTRYAFEMKDYRIVEVKDRIVWKE